MAFWKGAGSEHGCKSLFEGVWIGFDLLSHPQIIIPPILRGLDNGTGGA